MAQQHRKIRLSQDAAIVLGLARTAVPFAGTFEDEAERWVRVLRMHGQVGMAMQALGVGEAPLETNAVPRAIRITHKRDSSGRVVSQVELRAFDLADERGGELVSTVDVFFALLDVYGGTLDRALYVRGTTRGELTSALSDNGHTVPAPYAGTPSGRFVRPLAQA
jgi:hypothetical protein